MSEVANGNDQNLDVEGFAAKHAISVEDAQRLIDEIGYDTGALDAAAQKLKLGGSDG